MNKREEADMKEYETPVMLCRTFKSENILLTESKTDAQIVREKLEPKVSVNMKSVKWDDMK